MSEQNHLLAFEFGNRFVEANKRLLDVTPDGQQKKDFKRTSATAEVLLELLLQNYQEVLRLPRAERDQRFPWWDLTRRLVETYDREHNDPQPLENRDPILDYDPVKDEFFATVYASGQPYGKTRNTYRMTDVLADYSRNLWNNDLSGYTPPCLAVLEKLTGVRIRAWKWIYYWDSVLYIDGRPHRGDMEEGLQGARSAIWDLRSLKTLQHQRHPFLTEQEQDDMALAVLRRWRDEHRAGTGPATANEYRRETYDAYDGPAADEILCRLDDEVFTETRLRELLRLERDRYQVKFLENVTANELMEVAANGGDLQAFIQQREEELANFPEDGDEVQRALWENEAETATAEDPVTQEIMEEEQREEIRQEESAEIVREIQAEEELGPEGKS